MIKDGNALLLVFVVLALSFFASSFSDASPLTGAIVTSIQHSSGSQALQQSPASFQTSRNLNNQGRQCSNLAFLSFSPYSQNNIDVAGRYVVWEEIGVSDSTNPFNSIHYVKGYDLGPDKLHNTQDDGGVLFLHSSNVGLTLPQNSLWPRVNAMGIVSFYRLTAQPGQPLLDTLELVTCEFSSCSNTIEIRDSVPFHFDYRVSPQDIDENNIVYSIRVPGETRVIRVNLQSGISEDIMTFDQGTGINADVIYNLFTDNGLVTIEKANIVSLTPSIELYIVYPQDNFPQSVYSQNLGEQYPWPQLATTSHIGVLTNENQQGFFPFFVLYPVLEDDTQFWDLTYLAIIGSDVSIESFGMNDRVVQFFPRIATNLGNMQILAAYFESLEDGYWVDTLQIERYDVEREKFVPYKSLDISDNWLFPSNMEMSSEGNVVMALNDYGSGKVAITNCA